MASTSKEFDPAAVDWSAVYGTRLKLGVYIGWGLFPVLAVYYAATNNWSHVLPFACMWVLNAIAHWLFRKDGNSERASWVYIGGLWLAMCGQAWIAGMSRSLALWCMGILPMLSAYLRGPAHVIAVGGVAGMTMSCFTGLDLLGINSSDENFRDPSTGLVCLVMLLSYLQISYVLAMSIDQKVNEMNAEGIRLIRARFEADRSSTAKSAFLANMSQQIRLPLKRAMVDVDELCSAQLSGEEEQEAAESIQESARRIWYIVHDIVEISNMETGAFRLMKGPIHLSKIQAQVLAQLHARDTSKVEVTFVPARDKFGLQGDKVRIERVLMILVHHAFASAKSKIRVETKLGAIDRRSDDWRVPVEFLVQNDGAGVSSVQAKGLFLDLRTQNDDRGEVPEIGLGLSMVKRLVESMRGELTFADRPGELASMRVRLDLSVQAYENDTPAAA